MQRLLIVISGGLKLERQMLNDRIEESAAATRDGKSETLTASDYKRDISRYSPGEQQVFTLLSSRSKKSFYINSCSN